ncbi:MAG: hypothetical protein AAFX85_12315, partial [Pseudomonadota bacterium]
QCVEYPDSAKFEAEWARNDQPAMPPQLPVGSVSFAFEGLVMGGDAILLIHVGHQRAPIWRGPASPTVTVAFGERALADNGWDTVRFTVIDPRQRRVCGAGNEAGIKVWRNGARYRVTFLPIPTPDENGLLATFHIAPEM